LLAVGPLPPFVDDLVAGDSRPRRKLVGDTARLGDDVELVARAKCFERRRDEDFESAAD
jgi:hypothetical protein